MGFQPLSVGQVDRMRENIIDRGAAVGTGERIQILRSIREANPFFCGAAATGVEATEASFGADWPAAGGIARPPGSVGARGRSFARSVSAASARLPGETAAPADRASRAAKKRSAKEMRDLAEAGGADSSTMESNPTPVAKLATRTAEPSGVCDPEARRKLFGRADSEIAARAGKVSSPALAWPTQSAPHNPAPNPTASAATPAQIARIST